MLKGQFKEVFLYEFIKQSETRNRSGFLSSRRVSRKQIKKRNGDLVKQLGMYSTVNVAWPSSAVTSPNNKSIKHLSKLNPGTNIILKKLQNLRSQREISDDRREQKFTKITLKNEIPEPVEVREVGSTI